jgi:hypothetical protein
MFFSHHTVIGFLSLLIMEYCWDWPNLKEKFAKKWANFDCWLNLHRIGSFLLFFLPQGFAPIQQIGN